MNCDRCGENFDNYFNGYNWCPGCGKVTAPNLKVAKGDLPEVFKK